MYSERQLCTSFNQGVCLSFGGRGGSIKHGKDTAGGSSWLVDPLLEKAMEAPDLREPDFCVKACLHRKVGIITLV